LLSGGSSQLSFLSGFVSSRISVVVVVVLEPFAIQAAQLLGRAIGAGLFAITPAGERGMCCKAIKLGNARVFPVTTL